MGCEASDVISFAAMVESVQKLTDRQCEICKQLASMVKFHDLQSLSVEKSDTAMQTLRGEMRMRYFHEYAAADPDWSNDPDLCRRTENDEEFMSRFDHDLSQDGYSNAALKLRRSELRSKFNDCCRAVHVESKGAGTMAQLDFHLAHGEEETNYDLVFNAIDRLNPLFLQILNLWDSQDFTAKDLSLIR